MKSNRISIRPILVVFILSFLLRLIALNQSLWLDEATTAKVTHLSVGQILTQFSPADFHPPVYYLFMKFWTAIFGISEVTLRLPSVIFSLLTGWVIYKSGNLLANKSVAFWSTSLFLFNPLIIYYSQEARMYSLVTLTLTLSWYYFLRIESQIKNSESEVKSGMTTKRDVLLFNVFTGLSFLIFYASVYFIVTLYIYVLLKRQYKLLFRLLPGCIVSVVLVSPLLYSQLLNAHQVLAEIKNWSLVLGTVTIKNFALIPLKFATGRVSSNPKIYYYLTGGVFTTAMLLVAALGTLKKQLLLFFLVIPLGLGLIFSFITPMLQYFRFIYLIPIMSLLLGFGAQKDWQKYSLVTGFIIFSCIYLLLPQYHREDWKTLGSYLQLEKKPVYMIVSASDPVRYYAPNIKISDIKTIPTDTKLSREIIVIPYVTDVHGVQYVASLQARGYSKRETINLRGVTAERWSLDPAAFYTRLYFPE